MRLSRNPAKINPEISTFFVLDLLSQASWVGRKSQVTFLALWEEEEGRRADLKLCRTSLQVHHQERRSAKLLYNVHVAPQL